MENFPKAAPEQAPEEERVEQPVNPVAEQDYIEKLEKNQVPGAHIENIVNKDETAAIPEAPAGMSENGVATGVDEKLEAEADDWLAGRKKPVAPSVESEAPLGEEADGAGEATTA